MHPGLTRSNSVRNDLSLTDIRLKLFPSSNDQLRFVDIRRSYIRGLRSSPVARSHVIHHHIIHPSRCWHQQWSVSNKTHRHYSVFLHRKAMETYEMLRSSSLLVNESNMSKWENSCSPLNFSFPLSVFVHFSHCHYFTFL